MSNNDYPFGRGQAFFILIIASLLYLISFADMQLFAVVQETMRIDLGLTDTQVGVIQTVFMMTTAFALPNAFLMDRWSRKYIMGIAAILWSIFTFLTGLGRNFITVLIPRMLTGATQAGFPSGGTALLTVAFPHRVRTTVLSIFNGVSLVGLATGMAIGGYLTVHFASWRVPFYIFAIPGIVVGSVAFFFKDYKTAHVVEQKTAKNENFFKSAFSLLKVPTLWRINLGFAMMQITTTAVIVWGPTYIMRVQGLKPDQVGLMVGGMILICVVGGVCGGVITDKWHKKNPRARMLVPAISMLAGTAFVIPSIWLDVRGIGYVLLCLWGITSAAATPSLIAAMQDVVTLGKRAQVGGLNALTQYVLGGGWAPMLMGMLSDSLGGGAGGLKLALIIASAFGLIASFFYFFAARSYPADAARIQTST